MGSAGQAARAHHDGCVPKMGVFGDPVETWEFIGGFYRKRAGVCSEEWIHCVQLVVGVTGAGERRAAAEGLNPLEVGFLYGLNPGCVPLERGRGGGRPGGGRSSTQGQRGIRMSLIACLPCPNCTMV